MARILVIDDEPGICRALEKFLQGEGHEVRTSSRAETGLPLAEAFEPDLVILDVRLPGMDGLEALSRLHERSPDLPVLVVTAYGTMETAVEAVRRGAWDYVVKPLDLERTLALVRRAVETRDRAREVAIGAARGEGAGPAPLPRERFPPLLGRTPAMQEVFKRIGAVSLTDVPVLLTGESGTGKELAARAIHYASARAAGPFECVNSASIPEERLEEELFGSGARAGRIARASGGSLFLDEVSELPAAVQARLLRVLEEGVLEDVDTGRRIEVDVRPLSASHADLRAAIEAGRFREDLFYRLSVMTIRLPALRERIADIPLLLDHFLKGGDGPRGAIGKAALRPLLEYAWPGNVRELRNAVEHALVLARGGTILPEHLPDHVREGARRRPEEDGEIVRSLVERLLSAGIPEGEVYQAVMDRFEGPLIAAVLQRTGGNQVRAARILGIHRTTLRARIRKHGL